MVPDQIVATENGRREVVEVVETVEHRGDTIGHVVGETIDDWTVIPDRPETPDPVFVCEDCGEMVDPPQPNREPYLEPKVRRCNLASNRDLLADIHELRTGHDVDLAVAA